MSAVELMREVSRRHFEAILDKMRQDKSGRPTKGNKAWKLKSRRKARPGPALISL